MRSAIPALLASLLLGVPLLAAEPTLELAMSDPEWIGRAPERGWWDDDGATVYFLRDREGGVGSELLAVDVTTGEQRTVPESDRGTVPRPGGDLSPDRTLRTWELDGDVFWRRLPDGPVRQLTRTNAAETEPRFLLDGRRVAWREGNRWVARDLEEGTEAELAVVREGEDPEAEEPEDELDWLERQQLRLFDVVREERSDRIRERDLERDRRAVDPTRPPRPWHLGEGRELVTGSLSPSGRHLLLVTRDADRDDGREDLMPRWVTASGYLEIEEVRTKVGTSDGSGHVVLLLDLEARERVEVPLDLLPGIADRPLDALAASTRPNPAEGTAELPSPPEADEAPVDPSGPRAVEIEEIRWSPDGRRVQLTAHSIDNKDRWIFLVDPDAEPRVRPLHRLSDEAWINWRFDDVGWMPDSDAVWYLSEESGWSQLYVVDAASGESRRLTDGRWVVADPELSPDGESFVVAGNPGDPKTWDLFRVVVDTARTTRLTDLGGGSAIRWPPTWGQLVEQVHSPDGHRVLFAHSTTTRPVELWTVGVDGGEPRRLTTTVSEAFLEVDWVEPIAVEIPSSDVDRPIHGRFYPPSGDGEGSGAAVVFVHGAGYLQNAHRGWSGYFREFMFHTVLSRRGFAVLDLDYRGSAGYGREWRTAIYRHMGHPELVDLRNGVRWLVAEQGIDPDRVGVYGGSYGGFLTLMALFREPDLFACGAALRPVTDWAHYNHGYTSNILNTPEVDPEAYSRSSPIEFADGLRAPLLIAAPMLDDNVFFLDTVRLSQRLIELGKRDWEVALYPVEPHGFEQPSSWLDEYRRIERLFLEHLAP